jgi:hypothetical protein
MNCAIRRHQRLIFFVLLFAAAFLYLAHIGSYHLIELDEGRYHRVAMEPGITLRLISTICPILRSQYSSTG